MTKLRLGLAASVLSFIAIGQGQAGGCCPAAYVECGCAAPVVEWLDPAALPGEVYVVNQGPLFSGPGHDLYRRVPDLPPSGYPYVGFVYTGYPYGVQATGLYARRFFFSPFIGYPYAEPRPPLRFRRSAARVHP
jgi:hypothetical protein